MGGRTGVLVAVRWFLEARKEILEASVCFLEPVRVNVEQGPLILTFFLNNMLPVFLVWP
jgi:hypothetical protein